LPLVVFGVMNLMLGLQSAGDHYIRGSEYMLRFMGTHENPNRAARLHVHRSADGPVCGEARAPQTQAVLGPGGARPGGVRSTPPSRAAWRFRSR
jgi:hypothetical protein